MKKMLLITIEGSDNFVRDGSQRLLREWRSNDGMCRTSCEELEDDHAEEFNRIMTTLEMEALDAEPVCC